MELHQRMPRWAAQASASLLCAMCLVVAPVTYAQTASKASVEELLTVLEMEQGVDDYASSYEVLAKTSVQRALKGVVLSKNGQDIANGIPQKVVAMMKTEINWSKVKGDYIALYQKTFTQEEIDAQLAFYKSPVGRSIHKKSKTASKQSVNLISSRGNTLMPSISNLIKAELNRAQTTK